jgi:hypothetical protein
MHGSVLLAITLGLTALAGCDETAPMPGDKENIPARHVVFGNSNLQCRTRHDESIDAHLDSWGLLHVQCTITSIYGQDQYVDAFITFARNGHVVERIGQKSEVVRANGSDRISFTSTQPADDYSIFLDDAK